MIKKFRPTLLALISINLLLLFTSLALACSENSSLMEINRQEAKLLLNNAPSFNHGWQDKTITLKFTEANPIESICQATMTLSLPKQDLDEVNAYFDKNPAKLILLNGQGYTIPQQVTTLPYLYRVENSVVITNNEDNQDLKALHYGVEYMYQLLAQIRVEIKQEASNTNPWSDTDKKSEFNKCSAKLMSNHAVEANLIESACNCRVDQLSQIISPRQLELINYIAGQPYSAATGVLTSYQELTQKINDNCQSPKK